MYMKNWDKEYWNRLKQTSKFCEFMDIYKDHLKVVSIINDLRNKVPVDISIVKDIKIKYLNEFKIINDMKNIDDEINDVINDLIVLDNDLLYIVLYRLCDDEIKELLKSFINAEGNLKLDIFMELIYTISK